MSGLLALLDDVVAITKVAAASLDDVIAQATKAGAKAAGAVIDDAAVTPKYLQGFSAKRELPIVGRIALGSIRNKLLILLPAGLLLSAFAPWIIPILLMIGGGYLCFEGAEKLLHSISHHETHVDPIDDPTQLEETKVRGAIKTDFILSAEIMTIALAAIEAPDLLTRAMVLFVVAVGITALVYGAVAVIVKVDDAGLLMAQRGRFAGTRAAGRGIVRAMPGFLTLLTWIGTAAMLWVGGNIIVHGFAELGWSALYDMIHTLAVQAAHSVPSALAGITEWGVTASIDGFIGVILGFALIPVASRVISPAIAAITTRFTQSA